MTERERCGAKIAQRLQGDSCNRLPDFGIMYVIMLKNYILPVGLLAAGFAVGVGLKRLGPDRAPVPAQGGEVAAEKPAPVADATGERRAKLEAMRERIKELEAKLAARKNGDAEEEVASIRKAAFDATNGLSKAELAKTWPPKDYGAYRLEMIMRTRDEDPKQFTYMTNNMDRTSRWQRQQAGVRLEYFKRADVSKMTEEERAVHEDLLGCQEALMRIGEVNGIWDRSAEIENARREEDKDIKSRLVDLYQAEARTLVRLKALDLGYAEGDAEEIAESVSGLLKATYNQNEWIGKMD